MENHVNEEIEIDVLELFRELLQHWKFIVLVFIAFVLVSVGITNFLIPKEYQARTSMYVNNSQGENVGYIDSSDLTASRSLVSTYMQLIKSDCVLERVHADIDFAAFGIEEPVSLAELRSMVVCRQVEDTEIFEIRVTTEDPKLSAEIARKIDEVAPQEISRVFKSGSVEIIDTVKVPVRHISPSIPKNAFLGGVFGILAACAVVIIRKMLNQTVTGPADYEARHDVPLLGIIPDRLKK